MAVTVEIKGADDVLNYIKDIQHVKSKQIISRSINRTATGTKTQISISARAVSTIKAAEAKKGITIPFKATTSNLASKVVTAGKRIPLSAYTSNQTKKGVNVRIFKADPLVLRPRAFKATMQSGHTGVYWRDFRPNVPYNYAQYYGAAAAMKKVYTSWDTTLTGRTGITELFGPSLPDVINDKRTWADISHYADERLKQELITNWNYYVQNA